MAITWRERVASWLGVRPQSVVREVVREVREHPVREAPPVSRPADVEWRSLYNTDRDLTPFLHDRHLEVARNLATTNAIAKRCLEIHGDMVAADGITLRATSKDAGAAARVQKVLDEFADVNDLGMLWPQLVQEAAVSGEINAIPFTREADGLVRLGLILSENIDYVRLQPFNALVRDLLVVKEWIYQDAISAGERMPRRWKIMRRTRRAGRSVWYGRCPDDERDADCGEVFVLQINNLIASTRGFSDLLPVADWCDRYHQSLHGEMDRMRGLRTIVWDVLLKNAHSDDEILAWAATHKTPPRPNSILPHSEEEVWTAVVPDLKNADALELIREIFKLILGCLGVPIHYYVEAENVNRASAEEMSDPVVARKLKRRRHLTDYLRGIVEYALQRAREAGRLQGVSEADEAFTVTVLERERRDMETAAAALDKAVTAYIRAQQAKYLTADEAGRGVRDKFRAAGDEIDEENRAPVDPSAVQNMMTPEESAGAPESAAPSLLRQAETMWGRAG